MKNKTIPAQTSAQKEASQREERRKKALAAFVRDCYEERCRARRPFEQQWLLNMQFLAGNQYTESLPSGELYQPEKEFPWQQQMVFNHLAPLAEARLSRLGKVRPALLVRPATADDGDIAAAKVCTALLKSVSGRCQLPRLMAEAAVWSEVCGTAFYKTTWNAKSGEAEISVCPPFELFFDNNEDFAACRSALQARVCHTEDILAAYGIAVQPESAPCFSAAGNTVTRETPKNSALLLEYYELPSSAHEKGRLLCAAGGQLLYEGPLPYLIGEDKSPALPFVPQVCIKRPGCLWGASVTERCIPLQKAYNGVKNRRYEFLNRAAVGVLACEEGAVNLEELEAEGLSPGKIIVYRTGSRPPAFLNPGSLPAEFDREEAALLQEFELISGVSDMMRRSFSGASATGVALSLIAEQDDTRISITAENIRAALLEIGKKVLRLYRQFAGGARISRVVGENGSVSLLHWQANQLTSDDVVHETENELSQSVAQRRQMVFDLLARGLFAGENGRLNEGERARILHMLGLGDWESAAEGSRLQAEKAGRENLRMQKGEAVQVAPEDNHATHLETHARFMMAEAFEACPHAPLVRAHYLAHRQALETPEAAENPKEN